MADVVSYISQVSLPGGLYDIATGKGLVIKERDKKDITWNGSAEVEITIPTVADLLQNPIQFVGTVDKTGTVTYVSGVTGPQIGHLVFISENCTFAGEACEAGDMAVYDGNKWVIVSGENQVTITKPNETNYLTSDGVEVLDVEGKKMKLGVKVSAPVKKVISTGNLTDGLGSASVKPKYITLTTASSSVEVTPVSVASAVSNGNITVSATSLASALSPAFKFTAGTLPSLSVVSKATSVTVTPATSTINYVKSISSDTLVSGVGLTVDSTAAASIDVVTGITTKSGKTFVTDITSASSGDYKFSIPTDIKVTSSFAHGFGSEGTTGDVLSSVTVSASTTGEVLTGLSSGSASVVTAVCVGNLSYTNGSDFCTGLSTTVSTDYDVVTSVEFGTAAALNKSTSNALTGAVVNNHVLSFTAASFLGDATSFTEPTLTIKGKKFTKGKVSLSETNITSANFTKGTLTKKYKSLAVSTPTISTTPAYYKLSTGADTIYSGANKKTIALDVKKATVTNSDSPAFLTGVAAEIPANTLVSTSWKTAPTSDSWVFTSASVTDVNGKLDSTALTFGNTVNALSSGENIQLNTYAISASTVKPDDSANCVTVGSEGPAAVTGVTGSVTVTADENVVTSVTVVTA